MSFKKELKKIAGLIQTESKLQYNLRKIAQSAAASKAFSAVDNNVKARELRLANSPADTFTPDWKRSIFKKYNQPIPSNLQKKARCLSKVTVSTETYCYKTHSR